MSRAKTCRICGETKPLEDFYAMVGMRDGHRKECKVCRTRGQLSERAGDQVTGKPSACETSRYDPDVSGVMVLD